MSAHGRPVASSYLEFPQYFPQPGWVEHDATEIWSAIVSVTRDLMLHHLAPGTAVAAIGITNQRETVVAWDRTTGQPHARAIVWQDRRTAHRCDDLAADGFLPTVRAATGLVLDPYFSGSKVEWLLSEGGVPVHPSLAIGTIDDWLVWNLTGGVDGGVHATDPSNASRTMLYDLRTNAWSAELCETFSVPMAALGEIRPSSGRLGTVHANAFGGILAGVPVSGILGDQQAALFGQACVHPGMAKNTYGTGSFVLLNVGPDLPTPSEGLLTTVAWDLGPHGPLTYALEGSVFVTGAAIQWLRDGLQIIDTAADIGPLAASVESTEGVYFVPAFTGLGSPYWDPYARGTIVGLSRGVGRAHIARAVVESIAFSVRDVVDAMASASGKALKELRVDGGASVMDLLLGMQADQLGVDVSRPAVSECTALGAAFAAGLAEGVWGSVDEVGQSWAEQARFAPSVGRMTADAAHHTWLRAVERSRNWATE
jgi:glycerol kinase